MNIDNFPLWTALITPMLSDGSIDYESFEKLLKEQEQSSNGILILGSTGESLNLDEDEKKEILNFALNLKLNVPIMVGVGGINLSETLSWVNYLNTLNVHTYLLVTPLYAKPGAEGQYQWFKALMDASERPVILYNVPSRTGISLSHRAVQKLSNHPKLWGIKEASGSTEEFTQYVKDAPKAKIFSGDDALLPSFAPLGAKGLISVASNVWPEKTHKYVQLNLEGSFKDHELWIEACNSLFVASNPVPAKVLLHKEKRISSSTLRAPLSNEDMCKINYVLEQNEKIQKWS